MLFITKMVVECDAICLLAADVARYYESLGIVKVLPVELPCNMDAFGVVRSVKDFAGSEWVKWWGAIEEVTDRRGKAVRIPGKPWHFSKTPLAAAREAAFRGEHNVEVMKEYGYSDQEITALTNSGVLLTNIPPRPSPSIEASAPPDSDDVLKQAS